HRRPRPPPFPYTTLFRSLALAEPVPPTDVRPAALRISRGDEPGIDALAEALALAGYERVDRVEERGQFAVRGGIVDAVDTLIARSEEHTSELQSRGQLVC